jgi:hypothetical protein
MIELINAEALKRLTSNQASEICVNAVGQALTEEAQIMFRNSQRRVPVKDGHLRRSGIILPIRKIGVDWEIEMGYGGAAKEYALAQHERADYRHAEGKTWKYLEGPVRERIPNLEKNIAKRVQRILGAIK